MPTGKELPKCPIAVTLRLLGGKWKLLIIRNLLKRPWCFNELRRDIAGISHKMLTASLRELERDRLIRREEISEPRKCVQYSLTELGATLCPVFDAMQAWGNFTRKPSSDVQRPIHPARPPTAFQNVRRASPPAECRVRAFAGRPGRLTPCRAGRLPVPANSSAHTAKPHP